MMARSDLVGVVKGALRPLSRLRWAADTALSRRLFGNTLKLRVNVEGFGRALWTRQGFAADLDPEISAFYAEHAYYRPPVDLLPASLVTRLAERFSAALDDASQVRSAYTDDEFYRQYNLPPSTERHLLTQHVSDVHRSLPEIYEVFSPAVVRVIQSCFRSNFRVQSMAAWRMFALPPGLMTEPIIDRWHFDTGSTTRMRFLIPLTPMTRATGATEMWDRSYTQFLIREGFTPISWGDPEGGNRAIEERYFKDNPRLVRNEGPAGQAILFNPSACLHHAGPRDPGQTRDMIQLDIRFARQLQIPSLERPLATGY